MSDIVVSKGDVFRYDDESVRIAFANEFIAFC